jgi:hypothetical protein
LQKISNKVSVESLTKEIILILAAKAGIVRPNDLVVALDSKLPNVLRSIKPLLSDGLLAKFTLENSRISAYCLTEKGGSYLREAYGLFIAPPNLPRSYIGVIRDKLATAGQDGTNLLLYGSYRLTNPESPEYLQLPGETDSEFNTRKKLNYADWLSSNNVIWKQPIQINHDLMGLFLIISLLSRPPAKPKKAFLSSFKASLLRNIFSEKNASRLSPFFEVSQQKSNKVSDLGFIQGNSTYSEMVLFELEWAKKVGEEGNSLAEFLVDCIQSLPTWQELPVKCFPVFPPKLIWESRKNEFNNPESLSISIERILGQINLESIEIPYLELDIELDTFSYPKLLSKNFKRKLIECSKGKTYEEEFGFEPIGLPQLSSDIQEANDQLKSLFIQEINIRIPTDDLRFKLKLFDFEISVNRNSYLPTKASAYELIISFGIFCSIDSQNYYLDKSYINLNSDLIFALKEFDQETKSNHYRISYNRNDFEKIKRRFVRAIRMRLDGILAKPDPKIVPAMLQENLHKLSPPSLPTIEEWSLEPGYFHRVRQMRHFLR